MDSLSSRRVFCLLIAIFLIPGKSISQQGQELKLATYRTAHKIMLRWAPPKAAHWIKNNKYGYVIERYTILRDSSRVYPPEKYVLANNIKPAPLNFWENISEKDNYAAVVAQAIYGESFLINIPNNPNNPYSFIQQANDQEARYNYTLLSCDLSFPVAKLAGLGFEDSLISNNESYLYKIYGRSSYASVDTAYAYVPAEDSPPLPSVKSLEAEFGDRIVSLSWRLDFLNNYYSTYIIEKSHDNVSFERVGEKPSLFTVTDGRAEDEVAIKTDSILENNRKYYYRIRGVSPFGVIGPPSNTASGEGRSAYNFSVEIQDIEGDEYDVNVYWKTVPEILQSELEQATLFFSEDGSYFKAIDSIKSVSDFQIRTSAPSSYYKIEVKDRNGKKHISFPYLYQIEDSIPPGTPDNLAGTCDSLGNITLVWNKNTELDLGGYRVFKSINRNSNFRQITSTALTDTTFKDHIDLSAIRGHVYYQIQAVDLRGNKSDKSDVITVKLKDVMAPGPPRIVDYRIENSLVVITFVRSPSKDAVAYVLHKFVNDSLEFKERLPPSNNSQSIIDTLEHTGSVKYFLSAIDSVGNTSDRSNELIINSFFDQSITPELSAEVDRVNNLIELQWDVPNRVNEVRLYRAEGNNKITLYKTFDRLTSVFEDRNLTINNEYTYVLQFLFDMVNPKFSNELSIVF